MARPKKMTKPTLQKLEEGFLRGLTDREACLYAGIAPSTLYEYCKEDGRFSERKELLKEQIKLRAKLNIADSIDAGDMDMSIWYLERKAKDEFSTKQEVEHSGGMHNTVDMSGLSIEELKRLASIE